MKIRGGEITAGLQAVTWRICLVLTCMVLNGNQAISAEQTKTYSVPTRQFLEVLERHNIKPAVRFRSRGGRWSVLEDRSAAHSVCSLDKDGVFIARRVSARSQIELCEWTLFNRSFSLAPGWLVQRLHWAGAIGKAQFAAHPVNTARAHIRLILSVPERQGENRITLRLVTLAGPMHGQWHDAFKRQ